MKQKRSHPKKEMKFIADVLRSAVRKGQLSKVLIDLLTPAEIKDLAERLQIVRLLHSGATQRQVRDRLGVSISKVSRGATTLKHGSGGFLGILHSRLK